MKSPLLETWQNLANTAVETNKSAYELTNHKIPERKYKVGEVVDAVLCGKLHMRNVRVKSSQFSKVTNGYRYQVEGSLAWFSESMIQLHRKGDKQ